MELSESIEEAVIIGNRGKTREQDGGGLFVKIP